MNKTATTLAVLTLSAVTSFAGTMPAPAPAPMPPPITSDRCAGPISYNNVELLYANTDIGVGGDADGVRLNFEYSPASNFYVRLTTGYDEGDYWDSWHVSAAIGGYVALTENIHLAADGGVLWTEFDEDYWVAAVPLVADGYWGNLSLDDTGWFVRPHFRAKWGCLEVHAGVQYTDIWDEDEWAFFANAYYQIANGWDVKVGYNESERDSDAETWSVGVRWRY